MRALFTSNAGVCFKHTPGFFKPATAILVVLWAAVSIANAQAPNISYTTPQVYTAGSAISPLAPTNTGGVMSPKTGTFGTFGKCDGIAVDAAGDVYIGLDGGTGEVIKIPAGGGSSVLISAWVHNPTGIAVDPSGNMFVADNGYPVVFKYPATGASPTDIYNIQNPYGVAADATGNIYVSDYGANAIKKISAGSTGAATIKSNYSGAAGIAVDAQGNIYVANIDNNVIQKINPTTGIVTTLASGYGKPDGVAVDASGNVYFSDLTNSLITELPAGGGPAIKFDLGLKTIKAIALDAAGNIYVTDRATGSVHIIYKNRGFTVNPALPPGLSIDPLTGIISGTPLQASVAANYTITATNTSGSSSTTVNIAVNLLNTLNFSYSSPQSYYTGSAIAPLAPLNTGGAIPGTTPVNLGTLSVNITSVAVDAAGSIYIVGKNSTGVTKLTNGTFTTLGSTLLNPTGVAVDAAGNVFIADYGHNSVKEIPAGSKNQVNFLFPITGPLGIAVDAADNIYVATANGDHKIAAGTQTVTNLGGANCQAIAVDAAGNVYSCNTTLQQLTEIPVATGKNIVIANGISTPDGIAVDANGNVYYTQGGSNITEIPANGSPALAVVTGLNGANCLALDATANIFTESSGNAVLEAPFGIYSISPALTAGLTFDRKTGIISGTPQSIMPGTNYTVIASNATGSSATTLNIAIINPPKPNISYSTPQTYNIGTSITISPANTGGAVPPQTPATLLSETTQALGLAVDATGNIYIASPGSGNQGVFKYAPGSNAPATIGSGSNPYGVALDPAGNIFIADGANNVIKEVLAANGTAINYGSGFNGPVGVAVDASDNVYVVDQHQLYKIPAGGGTAVVAATGLSYPESVAVDPSGNVYIANTNENDIKELQTGSNTLITFATGFKTPTGVTVDPAGNVFVVDAGNKAIKRIPAGGGTPVTIAQAIQLYNPHSIVLDANGNIDIGDRGPNGLGIIYQIDPGYFINPSLPQGLSLDQNTGLITGNPTVTSPKTNYSISARNSNGVSVATLELTINPYQKPTIAYTTPQVYAVNTAIAPLVPASNAVFQAGFTRNASAFASGLSGNQGIALDPSGNVYAAEPANNTVVKIASGGAVTTLGSGFSAPTAVAVDRLGNVFVADNGNHAVKEITTGGTILTLGSGFTNPGGVAVDRSGNVYVADNGFGIKKVPAGNGTPVTLTSSTYNNATSVAADGNGNVFFTMGGVYEILASNNTVIQFTNNSANNATSIAVDGNDNIFYSAQIAGNSNRGVFEIPSGDILSTQLNLGLAANTDNLYLAQTGQGLLFLSDPITGIITKGTPMGGYFVNLALPAGLSINTGTGVISGSPVVTSPASNYIVTGYNGKGAGSGTLNIKTVAGTNSSLTNLTLSAGILRPSFATATKNYTVAEPYTTSSITLTPTTTGTVAILVNGVAVASGAASGPIPLVAGANTISVCVTANNGTTASNYTINVIRAGNAALTNFTINAGTLSPSFAAGIYSYSATMPAHIGSISITPTLADTTGTITINGKAIATGTASPNIQLALGNNTITTVTTAADGITTQTYTLTVLRPSSVAGLNGLRLSAGSISPAFNVNTLSYTVNAGNSISSLTVTPTTADETSTVTVNGTAVSSGSSSDAIALSVGSNTITVIVTAQDNSTTKTYTLTVTRAASGGNNFIADNISVTKMNDTPALNEDGVIVHQGVSPNGDGINDFLTIENITNYPDNKLSIMNRNGQLIYETRGYDNQSKVFGGRSNKTGQMQLPGTYFYQLDYMANGVLKHKTGYLILKY